VGALYPGDPLRHIIVVDRVFRSGLRFEPPSQWFGQLATWDGSIGRPVLNPGWAEMMDLGAHERLRHYIEVRVELWEFQVVASLFLRIHVQGNLLEMDGLATLLPPVAHRYRQVANVLPPDILADGTAVLWEAISELPTDIIHAAAEPWARLRSAVHAWNRGRWYRRMIESGRAVDHAPELSVRELGAEPYYQQRFQEADVDRFFQSVKKRAFTAVLETLRSHGYDTSEFDRIVNQNIDNSTQFNGPVNNSGQFAAGPGASTNPVTTPQPQLAP
jgi:hypothetical protein